METQEAYFGTGSGVSHGICGTFGSTDDLSTTQGSRESARADPLP